jgi:predicted DNA-binding protein with PD1-like motif
MGNYTFRLKPGQDLFDSIELHLQGDRNIEAGCVLSAVGSLTHVAVCALPTSLNPMPSSMVF